MAASVLGAAPAAATEHPVWDVSAESFPTNLPPGGVGEYLLHIKNVGLVPSDGSTVTVIDRLPPGVTAISAGGQLDAAEPPNGAYWECPGTNTTVVTCTNNPVGLPTIAPGGTNLRAGKCGNGTTDRDQGNGFRWRFRDGGERC